MTECKLYPICNYKTAICKIKEPDGSCYYYRYFNNLILNENQRLLQGGAINYQTFLNNLLSQIKEH